MTQRTQLQTMTGAVLALSATLPATYDAAGYGNTAIVYTTIAEVEDFGTHGMKATITKFIAASDGVVKKFKGSKDYGAKNFVFGNLPSDSGQALVDTASESTNKYSAKITYPTGIGESTPEIQYLDVLVGSAEYQDGNADAVRKRGVVLEVCRKPVVVAAT